MTYKTQDIKGLHFITNQWANIPIEKQIEQACIGECKIIQLRLKNTEKKTALNTAINALNICKTYNAKLIINDFTEIAQAINADGVHLGQNDMNINQAREILGKTAIIGATANTLQQIKELSTHPINYIGLGPFRTTKTKQNLAPTLGLTGYSKIISEMHLKNINTPVIAIGGIAINDIKSIISTGVQGIAISSTIANSNTPKLTTEEIIEKIKTIQNFQ